MVFRSLILALVVVSSAIAAPEYKWEKLDGCTLVSSKWKDGDSFHVKRDGKEHIFRLYFVDTPEDEGRFPERIAEQAAYFGCSSDRAMEIGREAADFTEATLKAGTFTVWTLWQDAMGASSKPRYYAIVETRNGNLAELLVKNGLARIYGKRIEMPDGTDSRAYLAKLAELKEKAITEKRGGWATN